MFKKIIALLLSILSIAALASEPTPDIQEVEDIVESYWDEP